MLCVFVLSGDLADPNVLLCVQRGVDSYIDAFVGILVIAIVAIIIEFFL